MTTINNTVVYNVVYGNMISLSYTDYEDEVNTKSKVNHDLTAVARGVARPGHTRAAARALGYFALPSAAFPAIKMAYKL